MSDTQPSAQPPTPVNASGSSLLLMAIGGLLLLVGFLYQDSLIFLFNMWWNNENYGHGLFVPAIALYLIWVKRHHLLPLLGVGSWWAIPMLTAGMAILMAGQLSSLYVLQHLSLWIVLGGIILGVMGFAGLRLTAFPWFLLLTTIPLPAFLFQGLTTKLRLISSTLGVGCLQLMGVSAYQDGNVIDLGPLQLQVVEACSGLQYIFPLMTLALLCAYFFQGALWTRVVIFSSSIPIAIFINGFRIGIIGLLVDTFGQGAAKGFLHFFEGWVIFLLGLVLLGIEMWLLHTCSRQSEHKTSNWFRALDEVPSSQILQTSVQSAATSQRTIPWPLFGGAAVILILGLLSSNLEAGKENPPPRQSFLDFPLTLEQWTGTPLTFDQIYLDALRLDDYILAEYQEPTSPFPPINLYVAYYRSQSAGQSIHSPQSCLPGGGWVFASQVPVALNAHPQSENPPVVNLAIIKKGHQRQLMLYWFHQRHRIVTNEYLVKWYLLWDALTQGRTDGALVRVMAPIPSIVRDEDLTEHVREFATVVHSTLDPYVPQ